MTEAKRAELIQACIASDLRKGSHEAKARGDLWRALHLATLASVVRITPKDACN